MNNNFTIIWRDVEIGDFENAVPDMWYLEGEWKPNSKKEAQTFTSLVSEFDAMSVMKDWKNGTRVLLKSKEEIDVLIHALIISLNENKLLLRRVFENEAIERLLKNVQ